MIFEIDEFKKDFVSISFETEEVISFLVNKKVYKEFKEWFIFNLRFAKKFFLNASFSLVNSMPEKFKTDEDVILWGTNLYNRTQKEFSNLDVIEDNIKKKMELINNQYCLIWKPV